MRKRKLKLPRKVLWLLLLLFVAAVILVFVFRSMKQLEEKQDQELLQSNPEKAVDLYANDERAMLFRGGRWYALREGIETVLLMGLDKFEEDIENKPAVNTNHQQADFCMLLLLDHNSKTSTAIHINRDTMLDVHTLGFDGLEGPTQYEQLALAHTYGSGGYDSCRNTAKTVSDFLYGVPVDHFVSLTMDAVAEINEQVGGVELTVMDDFTAVDPDMKEGATIKLSGRQALRYVRARQSMEDSTNLRRMERQQQYLTALQDAAKREMQDSTDFLLRTVLAMSSYMVSDCTADQLAKLAENLLEYEDTGIQNVPGEAILGDPYMEYYVDENAWQSMVVELFYEPTELE